MKGGPLICVLLISVLRGFALDREAFTFTKYDLAVRIEPEQQRLEARGTITLYNDSPVSQKHVVLQISSSLTWRSIQSEGKALQFVSQPYESDLDHTGEFSEAIVTLPKEVAAGGTVELAIGYEGVIAMDATRLTRIGVPKETAVHSDWDEIGKQSSAVRGVGNVVWYPVATEAANLSEGNSLFETLGRWKAKEKQATMRIRFDYSVLQAPPVIVCNGKKLEGVTMEGTAKIGWADCTYQPLGLSVPGFVAANYELLERANVEIAYRPEHKSNAEKFAQAADAVTPFVREWLGAAREKVRVAELFDPRASPYESGSMLLTPFGDTDPKLLQIAMVHELAHAAFPSNRPWIYEGLAHFAQAAYRERDGNRQSALDFLGLHRAAVVTAEKAIAERPKESSGPEESLITTAVDEIYRSKAAYVWWMLRDMLGEEMLKKVLAAYRADEDNDPTYVQRLVEAQSKRDLQWFFDDWVYHDRGLPDFRIESAFPRQASQDNYLVTVTVENLGAAGGEVPVTVRFAGGELTQRLEVRGKAKGVVRVAIPKTPTEIVVNDGSVPESGISNNIFRIQNVKP